jgi:hypothetical protein
MKTLFQLTFLISITLSTGGQVAQQPDGTSQQLGDSKGVSYSVVSRRPYSSVWERVSTATNSDGEIFQITNSYNEIAVGLNKQAGDGTWIPASNQIQIQPDGGAAANGAQHTAYFPGSLYNDAFSVTTPDGKTLTSRPLGLSYFDGERSILIAELTNGPVGQMLPSGNQIIYTNICTDIRLDLLSSYKLSGFESDLIIREQLPDPIECGFSDPSRVRLQWLTEFFDPPTPDITPNALADGSIDQVLHFGTFKMLPGKGFMIGTDTSDRNRVRVTKQWTILQGRTFLIEEIPLSSIAPQLSELPVRTASITARSGRRTSRLLASGSLPPIRPIKHAPQKLLLASADYLKQPGFWADYDLSGSVTNFIFQMGTTYYVSSASAVNLYGTTTIEGGSIIKFTNSPTTELALLGPLVASTGPYRMAVLTSRNDDSYGTTISGSTGAPTNDSGAIYISSEIPGSPSYTNSYRYLRFAYAGTGLKLLDNSKSDIWHCQFVNCGIAMSWCDDCTGAFYGIHNGLFSKCGVLNGYGGGGFQGEHITADGGSLGCVGCGAFTNSILTGVTNLGSACLDHSVSSSSSAGFFQSAGAANYYLVDNSTNRNAGTTNINSAVLSDLKQKTTYPPFVCSNVTWTASTTLTPQAQRDTDAPDLGYHYAPIDFITHLVSVTNCSLTLAPGTAVACYNWTGIALQEGSSITSIGTPLTPNWLASYQGVQEQSIALGGSTASWSVNPYHTNIPAPTGTFRFTRFVTSPGGGNQIFDSSWSFGTLLLQDSELWGGVSKLDGATSTSQTVINNLFYRGTCQSAASVTNSLSVSNNLFWSVGSLELKPVNSALWSAYNNIFDSCTFFVIPGTITSSGNNAYWNCNKQLNPTNASDITLTTAISYQSGPLGNFYQLTNSSLINTGSCTADIAGLYHYTVTTNLINALEIKETNSVVDIGLHYIAVDSNNQPCDKDGDTLADYLEDFTGNGTYDSSAGETDWLSYNSPNRLVAGTGLQVYTPLK